MLTFHALAVALSLFAADSSFKPKPFDWPQWQGPDRTAAVVEPGLLQEWPKEGPPLAWRIKGLGEGFSTPTIAAGRIFSMGNIEKTEMVMAFAEADGKPLWSHDVGPVRADGGGYHGPRCSPTVDGDVLYALGLNGDLLCLKIDSGDEVWRKDLIKDFKGARGGWGYAESPLIDGDKLLCTPGGKDNTIVALNKKTGEKIWSCPVGDGAAYSSIIAVDVDGKRQYVQFLGGGVVGVSEDGKLLWRYNKPANGTANCSTPLFSDGCVFAASAYGTGGGLARINHDGDKYTADEVYFTKHMQNHHGGMVLRNGFLYGADEGRLTCINLKTGDTAWSTDKTGKGSVACVGNRLYFRNENGPILLIEVNPYEYVEHGQFNLPDKTDKPQWTHPVVANGKLYIRDQDMLFCYDVTRH
ncbi:MAG TPA: PQQ-binding-like beta-propeller repeat protein [Gemmataceae bacterium]|nr:PQQ-binding-like beta-propeller repeat protein [Gemmataceae bacterium]